MESSTYKHKYLDGKASFFEDHLKLERQRITNQKKQFAFHVCVWVKKICNMERCSIFSKKN